MTTAVATICSTEAEAWDAIEAHVAELVASGLVLESGWPGRPLMHSPLPHGNDVVYDPDKVEKVLKTFAAFEHIKGRWARHPFRLLDWQVLWEIAPVFGLVDAESGLRILRTAYIEKPRKNGKSSECSAIALVLAFADGEEGAEVYAAAGDKDQAKIVFNPAKIMAERCPALRKKLGRGIQAQRLEHPGTASIFRPLSADRSGNLHGLNVHGGIVDELHVHKRPDTLDAIETGTGSREQPLIVIITTADEGKVGSIYDTKRTYAERVCSRMIGDRSWYVVIFAATDAMIDKDPFGDDTLIAANPGAGWTVDLEYLRGKAREASVSPAQLNRYLRLHLGKRTKSTTAWLTLPRWDAAAGLLDLDKDFQGRTAYMGIDLSATTDFTAAAWLAHADPAPGYLVHCLFWIPEERVDKLERQLIVPLREWNRQGWLRFTEGNVVDYARVRADIEVESKRLGVVVAEVGYDPWNAAETVQEMQNSRHTMVPLRQGFGTLSGPSKELERLVLGSTPAVPLFRHGGNPVLRWMADCVEVMSDPAGNIKPMKPDRQRSTARIDGIAACVNALARAMLRTKRRRRAGGNM